MRDYTQDYTSNIYRGLLPERVETSILSVTSELTLNELKEHLYIYDTNEDEYLTNIILTAQEIAHNYLGEYLVDTTLIAYYNRSVSRYLFREKFVKSVTSLQYYPRDASSLRVVPTSVYIFDRTGNTQSLVIKQGERLLQAQDVLDINYSAPVVITYVAGLPDDSAVTVAKKHALMLIASDLYSNRTDERPMPSSEKLMKSILAPLRRVIV